MGPFSCVKPALTFQQQLDLLESRGLIVDDERFALKCLSDVNYYRLRGYWITFQNRNDSFKTDTRFDTIWDVYQFDKDLRLWLWVTLAPIEIKLRTQFAYHTSLYRDAFAYLDSGIYYSSVAYEKAVDIIHRELKHQSNTLIVRHNMKKYGRLPVWAAVEIMSFGCVSKLYSNLKRSVRSPQVIPGIRESIAHAFGIKNVLLKSWMHHLTLVRNIVAHHERFYGRPIDIQPLLPKHEKQYASNKEFPTFVVLHDIYMQSWPDQWESRFNELKRIFASHRSVDLTPMGFPNDWETVISCNG